MYCKLVFGVLVLSLGFVFIWAAGECEFTDKTSPGVVLFERMCKQNYQKCIIVLNDQYYTYTEKYERDNATTACLDDLYRNKDKYCTLPKRNRDLRKHRVNYACCISKIKNMTEGKRKWADFMPQILDACKSEKKEN